MLPDLVRVMTTPLFSVVIPCFNVVSTVVETIESVRRQTISDFEIVAVDNNSTDATRDVLEQLARAEPRLRVVHEPVQGLAAARNGGIRASRGRYIAFLDADDLFDPDYLEAHAANLADGTVGLSYSRIRLVDQSGEPTGNVTNAPMEGLQPSDLLRTNPCTSMVVVRRDVLERAGCFDEGLRRVEDQEWLFRVALSGAKLRGIARPLASYRITPGGLSNDLEAMLASHELVLKAAKRIAPELVASFGRLSRAAMFRYCARRALDHKAGDQAARQYLWRMLKTAPDLLIREPLPTMKVIAAVLTPGLARLGARSLSLRPGDVR